MAPLFALIFAIVDFGYAMFLRSTFQHAVREGARYAVTYQVSSGGQDNSIATVVQTNALGLLNGATVGNGTATCTICIRYYNPNTLAFTTANTPGNIVEVSVENYGFTWMAPIWRSQTGVTITARAADRTEALGGGQSVPAR